MASGTRIPVTEVALRGGKIVLTCTAAGPIPASDGVGAVTVFGEDGTGVGQGYCNLTWSEVRPCDTLALSVTMGFESCYGDVEAVTR
jgi:hypothetical protein